MKHGLHNQLLFHWMGDDIESRNAGANDGREQADVAYLSYLDDVLTRQFGVRLPRKPEVLIYGSCKVSQEFPTLSFTEWSLKDSSKHVARYGRMGFGFTRPWVLKNGGQPVTYAKCNRGMQYMKAAVELGRKSALWDKCERDALKYLLHFIKPIKPAPKKHLEKQRSLMSPSPRDSCRDPHRRVSAGATPFIEEREWRIVQYPSKHITQNATERGVHPLKYVIGRDLVALVVPSNALVNKIVSCDKRRKLLFPMNGPHVTVLSYEDIGTF